MDHTIQEHNVFRIVQTSLPGLAFCPVGTCSRCDITCTFIPYPIPFHVFLLSKAMTFTYANNVMSDPQCAISLNRTYHFRAMNPTMPAPTNARTMMIAMVTALGNPSRFCSWSRRCCSDCSLLSFFLCSVSSGMDVGVSS